MQRQAKPVHHRPDPPKRFPGPRLRGARRYEIIGISDQHTELATPRRPNPIQLVRVDVGQQLRDPSALRCARQRLSHRPILHHSRFQPLSDYLQHPSIRDALLHQLQPGVPFNVVGGILQRWRRACAKPWECSVRSTVTKMSFVSRTWWRLPIPRCTRECWNTPSRVVALHVLLFFTLGAIHAPERVGYRLFPTGRSDVACISRGAVLEFAHNG